MGSQRSPSASIEVENIQLFGPRGGIQLIHELLRTRNKSQIKMSQRSTYQYRILESHKVDI